MDEFLTELEKAILLHDPIDLASGALVASGADSTRALNGYLTKLDRLRDAFARAHPQTDELTRAGELFQWLREVKPQRYELGGSFRLTEVIDAQMSPDAERVGNCLGLTLLYNTLAQRVGLSVEAIYLEEAFGRGPHVFSLLRVGKHTCDIEHVSPDGFDYRGHPENPERVVWGDAELVADVYHSAGQELHERNQPQEAVLSYSKALRLNPAYTKARLNRGIALVALGRVGEAERDLTDGR
jgi:tetratricopeptide (TPR) repeat protein